ncbi:carboxylate--amine ligase, partial [Mycobacterium ulcerans]
KALDLARGFSKAGCRVLVAEPYGWTLAGVSRHVAREFKVPAPVKGKAAYLASLAEIVRRESVDLVVPVSEETMHVAHMAGMLPEGAG